MTQRDKKRRLERPKHYEKIHTDYENKKTMSFRAAKWYKRKRKQPHTKRAREGEFKSSIKRLVHLHGDDNYKCPSSPFPSSLSSTSPLHLFV